MSSVASSISDRRETRGKAPDLNILKDGTLDQLGMTKVQAAKLIELIGEGKLNRSAVTVVIHSDVGETVSVDPFGRVKAEALMVKAAKPRRAPKETLKQSWSQMKSF